jgi:hypothetical protein
MAWFPPSRDDVDRGLWIPDLREGRPSPLSITCQSSLPGTCLTQRLSTQRLRRCGLSATSRILLPPCADGLSSSSSPTSHAARAVQQNQRGVYVVICDAIVLAKLGVKSRALSVDLRTLERSLRARPLSDDPSKGGRPRALYVRCSERTRAFRGFSTYRYLVR